MNNTAKGACHYKTFVNRGHLITKNPEPDAGTQKDTDPDHLTRAPKKPFVLPVFEDGGGMHCPRCGWVAGPACSSTRPPAGSSPGSAGSAGPSAGRTYGAAAASPGSSSPPRG